jgi:hypothetical protein
LSIIAAERNFAPAFSGFLDLGRHGTGPAGDRFAAALQNPGSRTGFLDNHPQDFLGKVGAGVTAERDIRQAQ